MTVFIHIGTRKGSLGLKNKNIIKLEKKPLIEHTLIFAKNLNFNKKIIINTDDEIVKKIAKKYKIDHIIDRPKKLANSSASKFSSWKFALSYLIKSKSINIDKDFILDLDNTCPLRKKIDVEKMHREFKLINNNKNVDCLFSITEARRNPYFQLMEFNKKGFLKISKSKKNRVIVRRQSAPKVYDHSGVAYFLKPNFLLKKNNFLSGNLKGFLVDWKSSLDIDNKDDFEIVKYFFRKR